MPSAEDTVTIKRPLHEVFAFIAEKENDPRWRPGVAEIERISGDGTTGTKYRQLVNGPVGRRIPADFEITGYEPGKRLEFRTTAGPVRPEGSFDLEVDAKGSAVARSAEADSRDRLTRIRRAGRPSATGPST